MYIKFDDLVLNGAFTFYPDENDIWIKCSGKTARRLETPKKAFYFSKNEYIYAFNGNNFYIKGA